MATVRITVSKELGQTIQHMKELRGKGGNRLIDYTIFLAAQSAGKLIKSGYQKAAFSRTKGTLEAYEHPARSKKVWSAKKPLHRSGTLADSVIVKRGRRSIGSWMVTIDPKATYAAKGDPHDTGRKNPQTPNQVAARLEFGYSVLTTVTLPMLRYLHAIRGAATKEGAKAGEQSARTVSVGDTIKVTVPPKPVWKPAERYIPGIVHKHQAMLEKLSQVGMINKVPRITFTGVKP